MEELLPCQGPAEDTFAPSGTKDAQLGLCISMPNSSFPPVPNLAVAVEGVPTITEKSFKR
ncbi:hypothetical protein HPP92_005372 [Vanilla planifolia]|uniref:Uncharacterized protein n=1 Tax=Vanilla planifolia TaxID=51239 RepID=A0A835RII9_VANPL|nr:hypothetical protein HPP92_005372 [Vanilla planifolia]